MFFTARNIFNPATMLALFVTQYCQVHFSGGGVVMLDSTCSVPWVLSILPNQPVRNQWNYQEKMKRHFPVKKKKTYIPRESSDHLLFDRNFNHFLAK